MLPCRKDFEPVRHVRFGSLADVGAGVEDVRFTPESGHSSERVGCPKSAKADIDSHCSLRRTDSSRTAWRNVGKIRMRFPAKPRDWARGPVS